MTKPALPSIDDDLAQPAPKRLNLRALKPRRPIDDAAVEANSRAIGERWGATTSLPAAVTPLAPKEEAVPLASLRLEIPAYLDDALTLKAAETRVTKSFLVMTALAQAGYQVDARDLIPDRRKARSRKE